MRTALVTLPLLLSACIESPARDGASDAAPLAEAPDGQATHPSEDEPAACADALDLAAGEPLESPDWSTAEGFFVRGLGADRIDPTATCVAHTPLNGRELIVHFTAERAGVHWFRGGGSRGHFYRLASDCRTPVACANTGVDRRALLLDLDPGERVYLALDTADDTADDPVQIEVVLPGEDFEVPTLDAAGVTVGDGRLGVIIQHYDWHRRIEALPWITAVVTTATGDTAEVPLTAVVGVGHGLMTAAGAAPLGVALAPGDEVTVHLADLRDGEARWTTEPVPASVGGPLEVWTRAFCVAGLWTCSVDPCEAAHFLSPADPGVVRTCGTR